LINFNNFQKAFRIKPNIFLSTNVHVVGVVHCDIIKLQCLVLRKLFLLCTINDIGGLESGNLQLLHSGVYFYVI